MYGFLRLKIMIAFTAYSNFGSRDFELCAACYFASKFKQNIQISSLHFSRFCQFLILGFNLQNLSVGATACVNTYCTYFYALLFVLYIFYTVQMMANSHECYLYLGSAKIRFLQKFLDTVKKSFGLAGRKSKC